MQLDIQARNFSLTTALRNHTERRLGFALSARDDHIQRVIVRLSDINGPRGGADKCCHVQVVLIHLADVVIEDIEADLYVASTTCRWQRLSSPPRGPLMSDSRITTRWM